MFTLTIEDANGQVAERFTFDHGDYVVGRQDDCDIVLPSTSVSRQHARIFVNNGRCYVEDLGSANGVLVDGQRVMKQRDLGTASQIKIGDFYLYLEFKRPDRASQAAVLQTLFISDDSDHFKLVRINDSFAGEEFTLSEVENSIGRTDDNFILLSDSSISRHHARIIRDGERYTLADLGSSNGSRVNNKAVSGAVTLNPGDRVHFGNVEFVFAPGGAEINPADYAGAPGGGNVVLMAGLGVLLLLGVVIGGLIILGFVTLKETEDEPAVAQKIDVQDRAKKALAEGETALERRDWSGAVRAFEEVLALSPQDGQAQSLKEKAERELAAQEKFERAEALVEEGRHKDAIAMFKDVPEGTIAAQRASKQISHVSATLAHNLKNEAIRLSKGKRVPDKRLIEAHEALVEALTLKPGDEEALKLIRDLESKLKGKVERYEKPKTD